MSSPLVFSSLGLNNPPHITTPNILVSSDLGISKKINDFCFAPELSSDSSSIGVDNDSSVTSRDEAEGDEEVESKRKDGALSSLESIEESLPIKRGLSNYFSGKSKSFASLSDMGSSCLSSSAADLAKAENPFNKRRRILMASKARRASYSSLVSTYLPPLLPPDNAVLEEGDEEEDEKRAESSADAATTDFNSLPMKNDRVVRLKEAFRSPRSFSLSDLQHA